MNLAPTVRPPDAELCDCARIAVEGHRCQLCALARRDPVDQAFALACAAAVAEEALTPPQRIDLRRRLIAAERDALQSRLAKGPL